MNIDTAISFAALAHMGQKRKYDKLPYILHPIEVMSILTSRGIADEEMWIAAVLHDVVEDTPVRLARIRERFGDRVASLVDGLTDEFTKEMHPNLNRAERKGRERARQAKQSAEVQTIKYADIISNTRSIVRHDKDFARVYLDEMSKLLDVMIHGDAVLYTQALLGVQKGQEKLAQCALI